MLNVLKILPRKVKGIIGITIALSAVLFAIPAMAQVSGPCANCHTMHNSQSGEYMDEKFVYGETSLVEDATANKNLLIMDCIGCHTAFDGTTWQDSTTGAPIVFNTSAPQYGATTGDGKNQGLAGGNFYWVTQDSAFGHNIFSPDPNLTEAPGSDVNCQNDSCHIDLSSAFTGGGYTNGFKACQGCHMVTGAASPSTTVWHHADDSATVINSAAQGWYRFLAGHRIANGNGASGIEDSDWEHIPSSTDHNEYLGTSGSKTSSAGFGNGNTVSGFCSGCHGTFHVQDSTSAGASPWLRHPSDQTIPNSGEYTTYTVNDPLIPVARPSLSTVSGVVTPGTDMVMCLSCHRAHASPYYKMLRWDIASTTLSTALSGCGKCHSEKY